MRTDKQNQTSRDNGAKSKGPVTPEGKAASSQNAGRHNLCTGQLVLLSNEDPHEFHRLMDDYIVRFQPIDGVEMDLVNKMIAATWREKRVTAMETSLIELEMVRQQPDVDDEYERITAAARQTLAIFGDDTRAAAALLLRYGATARRAFASSLRLLRDLQGDRFNRPSLAARVPHQGGQNQNRPVASSASAQSHAHPNAAAIFPQNAGLASFILLRRRRAERLADAKTSRLPNEPERTLVASQGAQQFHVGA